jgi:hypothetical protein
MSARMNDHSVPTNHVILYVKAGWDGVNYGACPFCQRFYMVLDLKAKAGSLTYDIVPVNMARPLPEFKKFATKLPVLKHGEEVSWSGCLGVCVWGGVVCVCVGGVVYVCVCVSLSMCVYMCN